MASPCWLTQIGCELARLAPYGALVLVGLAAASAAFAEENAISKDGIPNPSIAAALPQNGDPYGLRADLAAKGITYGVNYIGESLANAGGLRQGAIFGGRLEGVLDADLEKLWGYKSLAFHVNIFQIHGSGMSRENLANILTVSSIEALPTIRLYELYLDQKLSDSISVRLGQMGADSEFFVSANAANFVNGTLGWPGIWAADHPSGGDAFPLSAPGVRIKYEPSTNLTFLTVMFDGDPAGPGSNDPQERDRYGLKFRVKDFPIFIEEAQFRYHQGTGAPGLPGTIKVGAWQHTGNFEDQRYDAAGVSMALGHNDPAKLRGDYGIYIVLDQQIYRLQGDAEHGVHAFARATASPADRGLIDFYADGGLVFNGFTASRPDDSFGIAYAHAGISDRASSLDRDRNAHCGTGLPIRDYEAIIEVYYKFQVMPGLTVQPDFQYIMHPGGHAAQDNGLAIKDAEVAGLRVYVNY